MNFRQIMSLTGPEQSRMNYWSNMLIAGGNVDDVVQMMEKQSGKEPRLNVQLLCRWISRFVGLVCVWA